MVSLLLAGAPAMAESVTLSDAFDSAGQLGWAVVRGEWRMADGVYHVSGSGQTYVSGKVFGDVSVEVGCRITDYGPIPGDWVGIVVGGDSAAGGKGHLVYLRYSGEVELFAGGRILAARPTRARERFAAGRFVRLGVQVVDKRITVRVDGETLIDQDVPDYQPGNVGLSTYDVQADFDDLKIEGQTLGNTILGEVLRLPSYQPVPGAQVEIYHSMDGYDSPVTRQTLADQRGRFRFTDLPARERAYWLRAGKEGLGGSTAWFVSVSEGGPSTAELTLMDLPRHEIRIDSAQMTRGSGFRQVDDPQCYGGSRIEVKETRPASERPEWWAEFEFEVARKADYVPHLAAGFYPAPHYWSDYWWSIDGSGPHRASKSLTIEGPRYGDRATNVWACGTPVHLRRGKHTLRVLLRDPAPHPPAGGRQAYWWTFDAAALSEVPAPLAPVGGRRVDTSRPELRWRAPAGAARFTVQYSQEPDFHNATVTLGGVTGDRLTPAQPLADGTYYWRVKPLPEGDSCFTSAFSQPQRFTVATGAPAISDVRVVARTPHSAVIAWRTDEAATCRLRYGLSALSQEQSAAAASPDGRRHRVEVAGLEPMTYTYYAVEATGRRGDASRSLRRGFCTPRGPIGDRNSPFGIFGQKLVYAKQMGEAGARWYSDYLDWAALNPARGKFDWKQAEERMQRARDAGVNLMITFWGTPEWVRPSHPERFTFGPDDLGAARDFFREVAAHCRGRADWWLPWIEPNVARDTTFGFPEGYWASRPHARSYAAYQRAAYEGAKAGNPECRVVGMGTAGVDLGFIRKCYDEGAADSFDVMNVHYYAVSAPFEEQHPEQVFADLRALMAEYGDAEKPILCSEGGGASSGVEGTNEETQADNLVRIYLLSIANNVDKLCWTFELDEKEYGSKRVDMIMWMGLFRFDPKASPENPCGEPKPSYQAFGTMTTNLYGTEYAGLLALGEGVRAYRFTAPGRSVVVAWAEKGERDVVLPVRGKRVTVVGRSGEERTADAPGGKLKLRLTGSPVYVREE